MSTFWVVLGSGLGGSLITIGIRDWIDRRNTSRSDRRSLYVQLLTVMTSRRAYMNDAVFDSDLREPEKPKEQIDALNALLLIDATDEVKTRSNVCFELHNRFGVSRSFGVPVDVDDHGFYKHRFDVKQQPEETRAYTMRMALSKIAEDHAAAVDDLAAQVKRELRGWR